MSASPVREATGKRASVRVLACCGGMISPTGAERMTFEALGALREQGADVHCVLSGWGSTQIEPMAERIGASWSTGGYHVKFNRHARRPLAVLRQVWDIVVTSAHLVRQAIRFQPTHLLVPDHVTVIRNYPAILMLRACGIPSVMRLCNAPDVTPFYRRVWRHVVDPVTDRFVCNSKFSWNALLENGVDPAKTSIIRGVPSRRPASRVPARKDTRRVIFIGQVTPPKGVREMLEAVAILLRRGLDVNVDVVGKVEGWLAPEYGDYWTELRQRADQEDLAGRVRFLGWREDVDALLKESAVHCCPSLPEIRESFAGVVLEAKAAGIPSVVFPTGGLPEAIEHGVDGWVCASCSAQDLAAGLDYFLSDDGRRERAGAVASEQFGAGARTSFAHAWWAVMKSAASGSTLPLKETQHPA
ncbi:MAG: glycosyltransferase family 4 protein [Vicinamibacterales bacterium]